MAARTHCLILILVFLVQLLLAFANVNTSSTLSTNGNNGWVSPSSEFAFGFRQINGTSTTTFILAIWYHQIPNKTIIWHAVTPNNELDLVEAPPGSQLGLTPQGLILTNPQGESIWTAQPTNNNDVVSSASMLDSGNFVLVDAESNNLWESFQNPTDTLLPNQSLQLNATLTSRLTKTNFTIGRFQLYFKDGSVFLSPLAWPSTHHYGSYYKINACGSASGLAFDDTTGNIYVVSTNGTKLQTPQDTTWQKNITYDPTLYYYRVTLEYHGVLTQYSHPRDNSNGWSIMRYVPDDICTAIFNEVGSGACGYNSYCSMENQIPTCTCPQGFSLVDQSNQYAGCQSNFTFICGVDGVGSQQELYQLPESAYINFPLGDYAILAPYSQQECQQSCLQDCMCGVVVYNADEKTCWKKSLPLINGIKQENNPLVSIFVKRTVNISLTNYHQDDCNKAKRVFLGSLIGSLLVNSILIASVVFFIFLLKSKSGVLETNLRSFTYQELKHATNGFSDSEKLGEGKFGIVYKGTLNPSLVLSPKSNKEREQDFKTELTANAKTYHKNLVRLIGFCYEKSHRMLVYEFMSNGTLGDVLRGKVKHKSKWSARVGYALGIARGLVYLHEDCEAPVMHCDIKPENVLIDEHLNAKISDFGLAKLLLRDQSKTKTMIRGTPGYVAPEWNQDDPEVTTKVDVYSFGVVLLEIICCIKNVLQMDLTVRIDYLMQIDEEAKADSDRLMKWIQIARMCIQENPTVRPTMRKVMHMLEDVNHSSHD